MRSKASESEAEEKNRFEKNELKLGPGKFKSN